MKDRGKDPTTPARHVRLSPPHSPSGGPAGLQSRLGILPHSELHQGVLVGPEWEESGVFSVHQSREAASQTEEEPWAPPQSTPHGAPPPPWSAARPLGCFSVCIRQANCSPKTWAASPRGKSAQHNLCGEAQTRPREHARCGRTSPGSQDAGAQSGQRQAALGRPPLACQGRGRGCPAGREAGAVTFIYLRLQNGCENSMLAQEAQRRLEKCTEFFF